MRFANGRLPLHLSDLPGPLRSRIAGAIALAQAEPAEVPLDRRVAIMALRNRVRAERPKREFGCVTGIAILIGIKLFGGTWIGALVVAAFIGVVAQVLERAFGRGGRFDRYKHESLSRELLREAAEFADFGPVEYAAIEAVLAPRAGDDVRREVDRLLEEDARLVAALQELRTDNGKAIENDHLRLRLALTRETDSAARAALEASLALCNGRLETLRATTAVRSRIEAHRELVLQTLRAAYESLSGTQVGRDDLAPVREQTQALSEEVAAIEAAVQEMRST